MSVRRPARTLVLPAPYGPDQPKLEAPTNLGNRAPTCIMPDNAFIEAFNGRLRAERLNTHWFLALEDARRKLENWRRGYNELRSHGAIGNQNPITLIDRPVATSPTRRSEAGFSSFG